MLIFLISILMSIGVVSLFSFNYKIDGLNRTIIHSPIQIFQYAIPLSIENDELTLYYNQEKIKQKYEEYLDTSVYKYVSNYDVSYYFYNIEDKGVCDIEDCQGVEVQFEAPVNVFYHYKNSMYFEIRRAE